MTRFVPPDMDAAYADWKANCGPCAMAALVGRPVAELRGCFPDFPARAWCNPTGMKQALVRFGWTYSHADPPTAFPERGLAFIQWEGPWLAPGVPIGAAYRHTHWIAVAAGMVFDVNAARWLSPEDWKSGIVPLLLAANKGATGWCVRLGLNAEPKKSDGWAPNPCGCGWCNVCGFYGLAPRAAPNPPPLDQDAEKRQQLDSPRRVKRPPEATPSLFGDAE